MKKSFIVLSIIFILAFTSFTGLNASSHTRMGSEVNDAFSSVVSGDGVITNTTITRNYNLGPSTYFNISQRIINAEIFAGTDGASPQTTLGFAIKQERYTNNKLTFYFGFYSQPSVPVIQNGSVQAKMIYEERIYRTDINDIFWYNAYVVSQSSSISYTLQNNIGVNVSHNYNNHSINFSIGGTFEIDLKQMFINQSKYQTLAYGVYPVSNIQYKEIKVPVVTGFELNYIAKTESNTLNSTYDGAQLNRSLLPAIGYYTTSSQTFYQISPEVSTSCSLVYSFPFVSCSGPSLTLSVQNVVTNPVKLFTVSQFDYGRNMTYDIVNNRITEDILNISYYASLNNLVFNHFYYLYQDPGTGGGTCPVTKPKCLAGN